MSSSRPDVDAAPGTNHTGRLVLTPRDRLACPERAPLIATLMRAGLIARALDADQRAFAVGAAFLDWVSFTGCAVAIEREPAPGRPFCHVRLPPATDRPRLHRGRNTRPPCCPGCRARLDDWASALARLEPRQDTGLRCPACGEARPPWDWDWRQHGGYARRVIEIEEVFPGEAVPSDGLLALLGESSGLPWCFFHIQDTTRIGV